MLSLVIQCLGQIFEYPHNGAVAMCLTINFLRYKLRGLGLRPGAYQRVLFYAGSNQSDAGKV